MISFDDIPTFETYGALFKYFVPSYKSKSYRPFIARLVWDPRMDEAVRSVSDQRCEKRLKAYVIPGEFDRQVSGEHRAIRFGFKKGGHNGIHKKERADFCLVGGSYHRHHLTVFYRSIELIGGLTFDLAIYAEVERQFGKIKTITIMSPSAHVLALRRKNNPTYERVCAMLMREKI